MKLLIIDDNAAVRKTLKLLLAGEFDEIAAVGDPTLLPALLGAGNVDAVLLDMNFGASRLDCGEGLFWLERIKSRPDAPAVVLITAFGDVSVAVDAMKNGADDFVTKPWDNDVLIDKLHKAISANRRRQREEIMVNKAREIERRARQEEAMTLDEIKMAHIRKTLDRCGGNYSAAAEQLGINRQTLYNLLKRR